MTIYIGADHRGFVLKEQLIPYITSLGFTVIDLSAKTRDPDDDFPDISFTVADKIALDPSVLGIIICGSGGGATIAANKVKGIRCTLGVGVPDVFHNRDHNNCNVLALASDSTSFEAAKPLVEAFLKTPFDTSAPRFARRLAKITAREK